MTQIAIVEDEPNIRDVVRLYLKRAGFSVIDFEDGQTALNAFNLQMPDLIILDVMLPGLDGFSPDSQDSGWIRCAGHPPHIPP